MKVYKSNEKLLDYIISKGVIVNDRQSLFLTCNRVPTFSFWLNIV